MSKQENLLGKGARTESSRVREPRRTALPRGSKSWVHGNGVSSWLSLASHLAWSMFVLTQGPSWWQVNLSAKMDSSAKDSGRLIRHLMGWHLLPAFGPSQILPVSFQWQHLICYQDLQL